MGQQLVSMHLSDQGVYERLPPNSGSLVTFAGDTRCGSGGSCETTPSFGDRIHVLMTDPWRADR